MNDEIKEEVEIFIEIARSIFKAYCETVLLETGEVPAEPPTDIVSVEQARRDRNLTETPI